MNPPQIDSMQRYGYKSFSELLDEAIEEKRYLEDIYGDEIKVGDDYYRNKHDELIHSKNFIQYAEEELDLNKKTR